MQRVRFVQFRHRSDMTEIRLARAYTKRKYIVKFEGCYHGHADASARQSRIVASLPSEFPFGGCPRRIPLSSRSLCRSMTPTLCNRPRKNSNIRLRA